MIERDDNSDNRAIPLRLVRSTDGPQLEQRYDGATFVLPMVKSSRTW